MAARFLLSGLVLLAAAFVSADDTLTDGCIATGTYDANKNYFSEAYKDEPFALPISATQIDAAFDFTVQYSNSYKIARDHKNNSTYVTYQCGAPTPTVLGLPESTSYVPIPLSAFAIDTDVPVLFLRFLGQLGKVKQGYPVNVDACAQKLLAGLEADSQNSLNGSSAYYNSTLGYPGFVISANTYPLPAPANYITFSTTTDPGPLARAEWIKYIALFFNQESRASDLYSKIAGGYQCVNESARAAAAAKDSKPVVAWLSYYMGTWTLSAAKYKKIFVEDAGGSNPELVSAVDAKDATFNMSLPADVKNLTDLLKTVDVVIDETYLPTGPNDYSLANFTANAKLTEADASALKFIATPNVLSVYGRYAAGIGLNPPATDWYEGAVVQPHIVLQEIAAAVNPSRYPNIKPTYFFNVAKGDKATLVTAAECTGDVSAPLSPTPIDGCAASTDAALGTPAPAATTTTTTTTTTPAPPPPKGSAALSSALSAVAAFSLALLSVAMVA